MSGRGEKDDRRDLPSAGCRTVATNANRLGFRTTLATSAEYLELMADAIDGRQKVTLLSHNLHSLYLYFRDEQLRDSYRSAFIRVDGMPVVWLLKFAGAPARRHHRVTWMDFFWPLMERAAERGWRVFYVGHRESILEAGLAQVRERLPGLAIAGHHGFFEATPNIESREVVQAINAFRADLCLVGMGMPRQELWVSAHRERIAAPAVLTCGACLEYIAGELPVPPRWLGRLGLEWAYRLAGNPRRYGRRYLVEPWLLVALLVWHNLRPSKRLRTGR